VAIATDTASDNGQMPASADARAPLPGAGPAGAPGASVRPPVFVIGDEPALRDRIGAILAQAGFNARRAGSVAAAAAHYRTTGSGCLVLCLRRLEAGNDVLARVLSLDRAGLPIVFVTGYTDVPTAIHTMKAGAEDLLVLPIKPVRLFGAVRSGLNRISPRARPREDPEEDFRRRLAQLTSREREVLQLLVEGKPNKVIARQLGISYRTVEIHRLRTMRKMGAPNLSSLVVSYLGAAKPGPHGPSNGGVRPPLASGGRSHSAGDIEERPTGLS
jgi:FixJ family two-component response regulator